MVLRPFLTNILADLQLAQLANQPGSKYKREKHGGEAGIYRAYGDVAKNVERAEIFLQDMVEKVVKHLVSHLLRAFEPRRVGHKQALHHALHLDAARAFHQQQISGSHKISEELRGLFGR